MATRSTTTPPARCSARRRPLWWERAVDDVARLREVPGEDGPADPGVRAHPTLRDLTRCAAVDLSFLNTDESIHPDSPFTPDTPRGRQRCRAAPSRAPTPVLELPRIAKAFGAVIALTNGTLTLRSGSIHALVGENGAGKSTLVKIIAGLYQRDAGEFLLEGRIGRLQVHRRGEGRRHRGHLPGADALPRPVGHREHLHGPPAHRSARHDRPPRDARRGARPVLAARRADRPGSPDARPLDRRPADHRDREGHLARRQVLVMDEPTAALSGVEVERLFAVARACATRAAPSCSSPTASTRCSHSATPSRSCATAHTSRPARSARPPVDAIVRQMVGRDVTTLFPKQEADDRRRRCSSSRASPSPGSSTT